MHRPDPRLIIALDSADRNAIDQLVDVLDPALCRLKIGKQAFTLFGPELVRTVQARGFEVFLDLKFHDIPNTVASAVSAAAELGVWMTNVHAMGGERMLTAAQQAAEASNPAMHLIGVTVLTSHAEGELAFLGAPDNQALVRRLAQLTLSAGLSGLVCSAQEAPGLRQQFGDSPLLVTPGIRPAGSERGDQRRVMTPSAAIAAGASYLVVGRPVTASDNPHRSVLTLLEDLSDSSD